MPRKPTTEKIGCFVSEKASEKQREEIRSTVCLDLPVKYEHEKKSYCVLHFPDDQKHTTTDFTQVCKSRLDRQENKFGYVYFSAVFFIKGHKFKNDADFFYSIFKQLTVFNEAVFEGLADFSGATFEENAQLIFLNVKFKTQAIFELATFKNYVNFEGDKENSLFINENSSLSLDNIHIDTPERLVFNFVRLEPNWFINTDSRKFVFNACVWRQSNGNKITAKTELVKLNKLEILEPNELLEKTCWQLGDNYEEAKSFRKASFFRKLANESRRLKTPWYLQPFTLHSWYWLSSSYGESPFKAIIILLSVIAGLTIYYHFAFFSICPKDIADSTKCIVRNMNWFESLHQSLMTAALQNVDYRKTLLPAQDLITLIEKILAPLQAALLALAIRRKFMR